MNRGEMRTQLQYCIGDLSTDVFAAVDLDNQLNIAMPKVSAYVEELETDSAITTVPGQERYGLPSNWLKMKKVELICDADRKEPLRYMNHEEFKRAGYGASTQPGEPFGYTIYQGSTDKTADPQVPGEIALVWVPDDNGTLDYTVRAYYYKKPPDMTADSDFPELPEFLHMAIVYKAAMHCAMRKKDRSLYADLKALYDQEMLDAQRFYNRLQRDRAFLTPDDDGVSHYQFGAESL